VSASNPAIPALAFAAALAVSAQTLAQNPPLVTDADIERVRRDQPTISEQDIEQARQRHRMPSDAELQAACRRRRPVPRSISKRSRGAMHRKRRR